MPMEANGQKASNPGARLASLLTKREKLQDELRNIEKQVFELETTYLQDSNHFGHVLKGFEGFLGSSKSATKLKRTQVDVMILVLDDQRVEAYLQMDRANQRREGLHHETE
ncbi:chromatin modification-related protein MEAF6-like isoform X2 [Chenopodium quinoa]|uniref:chromatin modification-related protein MEAF6-like isoform X2 n=1 Tax=Chenopodium quinoa TaxID=63459 RepID=UPI000B78053A|nr:chromatin modification-related protein MEAF6-like isoform X2 [Chenopodium quinoa]